MSEDYSDSFDTDEDEKTTAANTQTNVNIKTTSEKDVGSEEIQSLDLHDLFNGTLILLKKLEAYSAEHSEDWRAPTNMLEMLHLVQKVRSFLF